jgi:LmbE family N-acetylglucosaminyl deacetylase
MHTHPPARSSRRAPRLFWVGLLLALGADGPGAGGLGISRAAETGAGAPASSVAAPPQGAALLKVDLLGVFAHPDDETGVASTIASYALGQRKIVAHVYLTRGEGGGNMVGTQSGAALGLLREIELRDCLSRLGVRSCFFLDQLDWAYTESLAATLRKWGHEETLGRLVRVVRALRPDVMVTMNPAPNPGQHGHHQAAGVLAIEAFTAAADPNRFPDQLRVEGLSIWQARKIYISGGGTNATAVVPPVEVLPDGRTPAQIAAEALAQHRSQAFGSFSGAAWLSRPQSFTLVKSIIGYPERETDLLANLPPPNATLERVAIRPTEAPPIIPLKFVPRPAISRYQRWVLEQGIEHLTGRLRADVPLVAGEPNVVAIELSGVSAASEGTTPQPARLRVQAPADWLVDPAERLVPALSAATLFSFRITPPSGRPADAELSATLKTAENSGATVKASASALGHPIPKARVPRIREVPPLDGADPRWEKIPALAITPADLVQGKSTNEADSSALFRLAHDGRRLYVDVQVSDDRLVSNIAANDIKGHWRSDSVEICLDPAAGAEDTMGCYKLGIFPFDATGVVRAARDADANQGPIEVTAPGTRLVSVRTPTGYRVQASIPFAEIGSKVSRGQRLGFNLIIYDGDKVGAAPGENINKSRIAWAPRSGVQGRPEDWGRIDLE